MQRAITAAAHQQSVSVWLARYAVAGWNAEAPDGPTPVPDARWTLDQLRADLGEIPVVVLGHSMGARTAVAIADDPLVIGVVALAPWFPPGDPVQSLAGKHLVAAHGRRDRITSYTHTSDFVRRAAGVAASAETIDMGELGHYLIKGGQLWKEVALGQCFHLLGYAWESINET
jgi:pimeloyl-ACP methyl ester carboxylesterase